MRLDRLKQTQFMAFQIGLVTLSFLKLLRILERGWFQKWFQPFSFYKGASLNRFVLARLREDEKLGTVRMVARLCDLNRQVAEPDGQTWPGKGEPQKVRTRALVYEEAKSSRSLFPAAPEDDRVGTRR